MKTLLTGLISLVLLLGVALPAEADVWVNGYTRKDGTSVRGHYRSSPDGNPYNNYSYPGNTNPYTGVRATGNPSTYLNNYSRPSTSSYTLPTYTAPRITTPTYTLPSYTSSLSGYSGTASALNSSSLLPARTGSVVYTEYSCDYFIVMSTAGTFSVLEWYSGRRPITGDQVRGPITGFGFKDVYTGNYSPQKTNVWIQDYWLSQDRAVELYVDKCL